MVNQPQQETRFIVEWIAYTIENDMVEPEEAMLLFTILKRDPVVFFYDCNSLCYIGNRADEIAFDPFYMNWPPYEDTIRKFEDNPFKSFDSPAAVEHSFSQYIKVKKKYKHLNFTFFDVFFMRKKLLPLLEMMFL